MLVKSDKNDNTVMGPNKGIFPLFASKSRNFTSEGMYKFPLFGQKSFENKPVF